MDCHFTPVLIYVFLRLTVAGFAINIARDDKQVDRIYLSTSANGYEFVLYTTENSCHLPNSDLIVRDRFIQFIWFNILLKSRHSYILNTQPNYMYVSDRFVFVWRKLRWFLSFWISKISKISLICLNDNLKYTCDYSHLKIVNPIILFKLLPS